MHIQLRAFFVVAQFSLIVFLGLAVWSGIFNPGKIRIDRGDRRPRSEFQTYQPRFGVGVSRSPVLQNEFSVPKDGLQSARLPQMVSNSTAHGDYPPSRLQDRGNDLKAGSTKRLVSPAGNGAAEYLHVLPDAATLGLSQKNTSVYLNRVSSQKQMLENRSNIYHNWDLFQKDFKEMLKNFRVYVYPDAFDTGSQFSNVFTPHKNPLDPTLGNFFSEHMFKANLLSSTFYTSVPEKANLFFLPFSVNALRNDGRVKKEQSIADFVSHYVKSVASRFDFWNRTQGADHFYVCCHSVGRTAGSKIPSLWRNSLQVVCSSNIYHKYYVAHKDVPMPQIWPREHRTTVTPPSERRRLAFYAGRLQNSLVRQRLVRYWKNDSDFDFHSGRIHSSYEEAFQKTKFCLHVRGYEVNTARISDAIHFGCIPVIISNYYDLPFANVLDWEKFSIIVTHLDIPSLKSILLSVTEEQYRELYENVCQVRKHFQWHVQPLGYDSFHMIMYQLWLKKGIARPFQNAMKMEI